MATPTSMFGMSPLDVVQQRIQEQEKMNMLRRQQRAQEGSEFGVFAPLYRAGLGFGDVAAQAINQGVFGQQQDPMLKKATDIQSVMSGRDVTKPKDLNLIASDLAKMGYSNEAMIAAQQARTASMEERRVAATEAQVAQGEQRISLDRERLAADIAKEARLGRLTEAQIREVDARIKELGASYDIQAVKGPAGETLSYVAINKKNPSDVKTIDLNPQSPAVPTSTPTNAAEWNYVPGQGLVKGK